MGRRSRPRREDVCFTIEALLDESNPVPESEEHRSRVAGCTVAERACATGALSANGARPARMAATVRAARSRRRNSHRSRSPVLAHGIRLQVAHSRAARRPGIHHRRAAWKPAPPHRHSPEYPRYRQQTRARSPGSHCSDCHSVRHPPTIRQPGAVVGRHPPCRPAGRCRDPPGPRCGTRPRAAGGRSLGPRPHRARPHHRPVSAHESVLQPGGPRIRRRRASADGGSRDGPHSGASSGTGGDRTVRSRRWSPSYTCPTLCRLRPTSTCC